MQAVVVPAGCRRYTGRWRYTGCCSDAGIFYKFYSYQFISILFLSLFFFFNLFLSIYFDYILYHYLFNQFIIIIIIFFFLRNLYYHIQKIHPALASIPSLAYKGETLNLVKNIRLKCIRVTAVNPKCTAATIQTLYLRTLIYQHVYLNTIFA
jgi:hypothetical protein